jgi:hypothetical protein
MVALQQLIHGRMIAALGTLHEGAPFVSMVTYALVVFLRGASGNQLHALRNHVLARIPHQQMNMIKCHHIVEHRQAEAPLGPENPPQVTASVPRKLQ